MEDVPVTADAARERILNVLARLEALEHNAVPLITQPEALAEHINAFRKALTLGEVREVHGQSNRHGYDIVQTYAERLIEQSLSRHVDIVYDLRKLREDLLNAGVI